MARALVVGDGIAGLATAATLSRAGWRVIVRGQQPPSPTASYDDALGLWSPALAVVQSWLGDGALGALRSHGTYVADVDGYHDRAGQRLCGPGAPLGYGAGEPGARPSLLFLRRSALLRALRDACERGNGGAPVVFEASAGGVSAAELRTLGAAGSPDFDLLVGADGPASLVRTALCADARAGAGARPAGDAPARFLNFHVYRGIAAADGRTLLPGGRSFQAWGNAGHRLAAVPMPAGSVAWFATARGAPPPTTTAGAPGVRAAVEALIGTHFARTCGRTLLDATPADDLALPVLAHAHGARSARARSGGVGAVAACLVGDAAWQLDPILAQGAGVALEDAAQLAASVADWRPADGRAALDAALGAYGRAREPRVAALSALSALPDALGQMTGIRAALRDAVLRATPTPLSAAVFEFFLRLSLAPAPLAGSWSYEPPSPPPSRL